jgi:hypothetical protein
MTSFNLTTNYVEDPKALIRRTKAKLKKVSSSSSEDNHIRWSLTPEFEVMVDKTLHEFSAPTTANIRTGPETNVGDNGFELKPALINKVQASQFCGKAHEDASAHHHQGSFQRCHSTPSLPILTFGEGEAVVLRQQR